MKDFKNWLETKDYNPYPPDNTEKQTKDSPHYPKDKNLIQHTEKTQLQVREVGYCLETGELLVGSNALKLTDEQQKQLKEFFQ